MEGNDKHIKTAHMVLGRDLNHHDTLFAGQGASYLIECGFLAAQGFLDTTDIVFLGLDGFRFWRPVRKGETFALESTLVAAGRTSVAVHVLLTVRDEAAAEAFATFVRVDGGGNATAHGLSLPPLTGAAALLRQRYDRYQEAGR